MAMAPPINGGIFQVASEGAGSTAGCRRGRQWPDAPGLPPAACRRSIRANAAGRDLGMTEHKPHASHWGFFDAVVEDGRVVGVRPFGPDPFPGSLIEAVPDVVHAPSRI